MRCEKLKQYVLLLPLIALNLCASVASAQSPALTTVKDTVYKSDGTPASGTVLINWQGFVSADSRPVFGGNKTLPLTNGALAVALVPNAGGTPSGTSYRVRYYQSGGVYSEETWVVPASSPLANPGTPVSVTQAGTPGSTTYYYWCTATNASGETLLSPALVTTASHATLDGTNYNIITCATVTSATGYKAYRTTTSTAPSGTGLYYVGTAASTVINDQSNTLTSATIPAVNDTDPKTIAQVRVSVPPTPSLVLTAAQINGTAVVQTPAGTQAITAPASTGIPLQVKGKSGNGSNVFEAYDNQASPALQIYVEPDGDLVSKRNVLPFATGGALGASGTRWDGWLRALYPAQVAVTFSATPAFDASLGNSFKLTLTGNVTSSTISNAQTGQFITLLLCQDGTGSRTIAWPSNFKLAGGAFTLTTGANKCDSVTALYDGSNWYETTRAQNL